MGIGSRLLNHHLFTFTSYLLKFVAYTSAFEKKIILNNNKPQK